MVGLGPRGARLAAVAAAALVAAVPWARAADDPRALDVRTLVHAVETRHPNPFHEVSREVFEHAADQLVARLPELDRDRFVVELMRLAALGGDREGHQGIFPADPAHTKPLTFYPVRLYRFADGTFVVQALDRALVGAKVVTIEGRPLADVEALVRPLVPHDNDSSTVQRLPDFLTAAEVLHGLGVAATAGSATFGLELRDGTHRDATLRPVDAGRYRTAVGAFSDPLLPPGVREAKLPLLLRLRDEPTALRTLDRGRVVYLAFNSVQRGVNGFLPKLLRLARTRTVRRIVVDLRLNPGGDNTTYGRFLELLTRPVVSGPPNRLVVLIGRNTFSAAGSFAADVDRYTRATFVGEPTGGSPNQYGGSEPVELPAAGLTFHVAVAYQQFGGPGDTRLAIEPDVAVPFSAADFFAGRDPVLAAALALR